MAKKQNIYKGLLDFQSEFDHRFACWANNHRGWSKAKKFNKRIAKKRFRRIADAERQRKGFLGEAPKCGDDCPVWKVQVV